MFKSSKRRVRKLELTVLGKARLTISLRYFRTQKRHRSKRKRQIVVPFKLLRIREICISLPGTRKSRHAAWRSAATSSGLIIGGLTGVIIFASSLYSPAVLEPLQTTSAATPAPSPQPSRVSALPRSEPVQLRIPKIDLSASLSKTTTSPSGQLIVPTSSKSAAWYQKAPSPGEIGPAIIIGHVHSLNGPAVFWRLREMQPGDVFEIVRKDSRTVKFRVDRIANYRQDEFPSQSVYGNITYAGIRLITCGGKYDYSRQQYSHNTVVYGSMVKTQVARL
jgi:sortase (surface protein transpeptidase)